MPACCDRLAWIAIAVLALMGGPQVHSAAGDFVCQPANHTLMPFCAGLVTYPIASDIDQVAKDAEALYNHDNNCLFFAASRFACRRVFPECVTTTRTYADGVTNSTFAQLKLCTDTCLRSKRENKGQCLDWFKEETIDIWCADTDYYAPAPMCFDLSTSSTDNSIYWKAGLGGGLGLLALILLAVILRRHWRDNWSEEKLRAYDDAKAAKLRAKKAKDAQAAADAAAKEAESDRRKQAKQARKYAAQGAGAEGVPNGAAVVPAGVNSSSPPVPSGRSGGSGPEGFAGLSDIELGSSSPPVARGPASPRRDASSPRTKKSTRHDAQSEAHAQPPAARQKGYTDSRKSKKSSKKTKSSSAAAAASSSSTGPAPIAMPDEVEGVPSEQAASSSSAQPALSVSQPLDPDAWKLGLPTRVAPPLPHEIV